MLGNVVGMYAVHSGNRPEWSPIWSVIIRVITKLDDREAGVQFINHEVPLPINHKYYNFRLQVSDYVQVSN